MVDFLKSIIGGVGKNSVIKAEFFTTIRVVPDLDIFPDSLFGQIQPVDLGELLTG